MICNCLQILGFTFCSIAIQANGFDVNVAYISATSIRIRWKLDTEPSPTQPEVYPDSDSESETEFTTEVELFVNKSRYTCGQGNTAVIDSFLSVSGGYYEAVYGGLNSSLNLIVCIRVKVRDKWQQWHDIRLGPQTRLPPLLYYEPHEQNISYTSYTAYTFAIATPKASWSWYVGGEPFNTTSKGSKYKRMVKSPNKRKSYLQLSDWYDMVDVRVHVYYEAENPYGKVRSKVITIHGPYIRPEECKVSSCYNMLITEPSGVVMTCDGYDDSYPGMRHTWQLCERFYNYRYHGCQKIDEQSKRTIFTEKGRKLLLTHVYRNDSGYYVCNARNDVMYTTCHSCVNLTVESDDNEIIIRPTLIHKYPTDSIVQVLHQDNIHLECVYQTYPPAPVVWYHNSTVLIQNDSRHRLSEGGAFLDIVNMLYDDEGTYHCKIRQYGTVFGDSRYFTVHVNVPVKIEQFESKTGFIGDNLTLYCNTSYSRDVKWSKDVNTEINADDDKYVMSDDKKSLTIVGLTLSDMGTYTCNATARHGFDTAQARVITFELPTVSDILVRKMATTKQGDTIYQLNCRYRTDSNLVIKITWSLNKTTCPQSMILETNEKAPHLATLKVPAGVDQSKCVITCKGQSEDREACQAIGISQSDHILTTRTISCELALKRRSNNMPRLENVKSDGIVLFFKNNTIATICVGLVCSFIVGVAVMATMLRKSRNRREANVSRIRQIRFTASRHIINPEYVSSALDDNLRNVLQKVHLARRRLSLGEMIGRGQFGRVYKGTLKDRSIGNLSSTTTVAIKTMKYKADEQELVNMFLREAVMMKGFSHPHVLSLIGITFDTDGSPLVVIPYMENGDLRTYIQREDLTFLVAELLALGQQVSKGMAYLEGLKFIHRDLAARNCMVDKQGMVKVADFGLSKDIYQKDYYRSEDTSNPLPVRWMAPECFDERIFTTKSDVWSFGVLLWELITRGGVPYPDIDNWSLIDFIKQGGRMKQPLFCPNSLYALMLECWNETPQLRPSFKSVEERLCCIINNRVSSEPGTLKSRYKQHSTLLEEYSSNTTEVKPSH